MVRIKGGNDCGRRAPSALRQGGLRTSDPSPSCAPKRAVCDGISRSLTSLLTQDLPSVAGPSPSAPAPLPAAATCQRAPPSGASAGRPLRLPPQPPWITRGPCSARWWWGFLPSVLPSPRTAAWASRWHRVQGVAPSSLYLRSSPPGSSLTSRCWGRSAQQPAEGATRTVTSALPLRPAHQITQAWRRRRPACPPRLPGQPRLLRFSKSASPAP